MGLNQGSNLEAGDKAGEESPPASCGRPDNSWAAAKTVVGSHFTGAGHVTWLLLTASDTYFQAHAWRQLLWEPRHQGGSSWFDQPNQ